MARSSPRKSPLMVNAASRGSSSCAYGCASQLTPWHLAFVQSSSVFDTGRSFGQLRGLFFEQLPIGFLIRSACVFPEPAPCHRSGSRVEGKEKLAVSKLRVKNRFNVSLCPTKFLACFSSDAWAFPTATRPTAAG